jgi:hypothetical protein
MVTWRGYFGIEDLGLTAAQRLDLITALRYLGPVGHDQPSHLCHWCTRLDKKAAIFEAMFREDNLTINKFKNWLAVVYNVEVPDIDHAAQQISFAGHASMIITLSYGIQDRIRVAVFGGVGCDYLVSNAEVRGYLAANREAWSDET